MLAASFGFVVLLGTVNSLFQDWTVLYSTNDPCCISNRCVQFNTPDRQLTKFGNCRLDDFRLQWRMNELGQIQNRLDDNMCITAPENYWILTVTECDQFEVAQQFTLIMLNNDRMFQLESVYRPGYYLSYDYGSFHLTSNRVFTFSSFSNDLSSVQEDSNYKINYPFNVNVGAANQILNERQRICTIVGHDCQYNLTGSWAEVNGKPFPTSIHDISDEYIAQINLQVSNPDYLRWRIPPKPYTCLPIYAIPGQEFYVTPVTDHDQDHLKLVINMHSDKIRKGVAYRAPAMQTIYALQQGKHAYKSVYGGIICLLPTKTKNSTVQVSFSGVARTPYISHENRNSWESSSARSAPWTLVETRHVYMIIPSDPLRTSTYEDFKVNIEDLDLFIEAAYELQGLAPVDSRLLHHQAPDPDFVGKWIYVYDIQIGGGSAHSGIPIMFNRGHNINALVPNSNYRTDPKTPMNIRTFISWFHSHELGHNIDSAMIDDVFGGEVTPNILAQYWEDVREQLLPPRVAYRFGRQWLSRISRQAVTEITQNNKTYFDLNSIERFTFFMQLQKQYGWNMFRLMYRHFRSLSIDRYRTIVRGGTQTSVDILYEALSIAAFNDLKTFFNAWQIYPSRSSVSGIEQYRMPLCPPELHLTVF